MIAGQVKDLMSAVHLASDGSQVATGTIYCVVRLESDDADDGKYWDSDDDTWQASPVAWPTATHTQAGQWVFALPAAATTGKAGDTIHYTFTDDLDESAATTVCGGGEHYVRVEDPLTTTDLSTTESNIRGSDNDDLKDLSDQLDLVDQPGGAYSVDIATQEGDTTPISDVSVSMFTDSARTNLFATVDTGLTGTYTGLGMDSGTYYWAAAKTGTTFTSGSFVVSASSTKTLTGTVSSPSAPSAPNLCVIYGTLRDAAGEPLIGAEVDAYAITPQALAAVQFGKRIASATTDAVGYFELELQKLSEVRFSVEDAGYDATMTVPDAANQDISTWT